MAPFFGPRKSEVMRELQRLKDGSLEITLGRFSPQFFIRHVDARYELCPLILDEAKAKQDAQRRMAEGDYQPEMEWVFLAPGIPIIQASNLHSFVLQLEVWSGWGAVQRPST